MKAASLVVGPITNGTVIDTSLFAWTWGLGTFGELGNNASVSSSTPVSVVGGRQWLSISSSVDSTRPYAVAIDSLSYGWAWGNNQFGWLGDNTTTSRSSPASVAGGRQWLFLACGGVFSGPTLGLDNLSYAYAWGSGSGGALGNPAFGIGNATSPVSVAGGRQWRLLLPTTGASTPSVYGIDSLSYAWAWGADGSASGQLGNNSTAGQSSPVSVVGGRQWRSLVISGPTSGSRTVCGLDSLSYAWCWGDGTNGRNGQNSTASRSSPVSVIGDRQFRSVFGSIGFQCLAAIDSLSYAWAWGLNSSGQLGNNTTADASSPTSVVGGRQWRSIAMTGVGNTNTSTIALDSLSYAWAWGSGTSGQLGNNATANSSSPVSVVGGRQWKRVIGSIIYDTFYGIDSSDRLWAWGAGGNGQLGNGSTSSTSSPIAVNFGVQSGTPSPIF
jgi:alpha-tubulin suppressor-like RCC1 family protein